MAFCCSFIDDFSTIFLYFLFHLTKDALLSVCFWAILVCGALVRALAKLVPKSTNNKRKQLVQVRHTRVKYID